MGEVLVLSTYQNHKTTEQENITQTFRVIFCDLIIQIGEAEQAVCRVQLAEFVAWHLSLLYFADWLILKLEADKIYWRTAIKRRSWLEIFINFTTL